MDLIGRRNYWFWCGFEVAKVIPAVNIWYDFCCKYWISSWNNGRDVVFLVEVVICLVTSFYFWYKLKKPNAATPLNRGIIKVKLILCCLFGNLAFKKRPNDRIKVKLIDRALILISLLLVLSLRFELGCWNGYLVGYYRLLLLVFMNSYSIVLW